MVDKKQKILIVDGNLKVQQILKRYFQEEGFEVVNCYSGQKSIAVAKREIPDVIIIDILMPHISGIDVLKQMGKDKTLAAIPKIVLTNVDEKEKVEKAEMLGVARYLQKSSYKLKDIKKEIKVVIDESMVIRGPERKKQLIVMINDDDFLLEIFKRIFEEDKYEFEGISSILTSGVSPLIVGFKKPSIIIVDLVMCLDGVKVIEELKKSNKYNDIPIIVLDNVYVEEEVERAKKAGANMYISMKEHTPKQAVEKIIKYLNKK